MHSYQFICYSEITTLARMQQSDRGSIMDDYDEMATKLDLSCANELLSGVS